MKKPDGRIRACQKGDHPWNILEFAGGRAEEVLRRLSERHRCTTHLPRNHILAGWEPGKNQSEAQLLADNIRYQNSMNTKKNEVNTLNNDNHAPFFSHKQIVRKIKQIAKDRSSFEHFHPQLLSTRLGLAL